MTIGMTIPLEGVAMTDAASVAADLVAAGCSELWSSEVAGVDAFTPLVVAATAAPGARLGTAIVPAFTRGPAVVAMQAAALASLAPGRFALGIGSSSNVIVESWNGIPFDKPFARTRDLLRFLLAALAGERVTERYDTFAVDGFRLEEAPPVPPPVLVAALRERMLRLAGAEADGVILNWLPAADVPRVAGVVRDAAGGADREIVARIFVAPIEDDDEARAVARRSITTYLNVPVYAEYMRWLGHGEALQPMWDAWAAGDRKRANDAVPDELVDALVLHGSPAACRAGVARYVEHGVTTPVVKLVGVRGADAVRAANALVAA